MLCGGGHLEVLQWARANGCPWDNRTCEAAAHGGHLEVLQWAIKNNCPYEFNLILCDFKCQHLDSLKWLFKNSTCEFSHIDMNCVLNWISCVDKGLCDTLTHVPQELIDLIKTYI